MLNARPSAGRLAVVGGLATFSVGTLCLLIFYIKWRRNARRKVAQSSRSNASVQCDALLDPSLSSVCRAIDDVVRLDTADPDVLTSIDNFIDAGRQLLESWRNRLSPMPTRAALHRPHRLVGHSRAGITGDAGSYQDSAVDLLADFDAGALVPGGASGHSRNRDPMLFDDFEIQSNASSDATFLSAVEELEELDRLLLERNLASSFEEALKLAQSVVQDNNNELIPCRTLRTQQVGCGNDEEFLAKLHLLRSAYVAYFADPKRLAECSHLGREIFSEILRESEGNVEGFVAAYNELLRYCHEPENLAQVKEELATRKVSHLGFYDVVLDFVLMDALDELAETPSSVHSALSSAWLPESFKKGALSAAVSTAIRAKRARMKYGDGFMSRYYALSDHLSVPLAWAILGPSSSLQEKLTSFQEMVTKYLREIFSSDYVDFSMEDATVTTLGLVTDKYIGQLCAIFGVERKSHQD